MSPIEGGIMPAPLVWFVANAFPPPLHARVPIADSRRHVYKWGVIFVEERK